MNFKTTPISHILAPQKCEPPLKTALEVAEMVENYILKNTLPPDMDPITLEGLELFHGLAPTAQPFPSERLLHQDAMRRKNLNKKA